MSKFISFRITAITNQMTKKKEEKKPGFCGITEEIIISHNSRHDVAPFDVVPKQQAFKPPLQNIPAIKE